MKKLILILAVTFIPLISMAKKSEYSMILKSGTYEQQYEYALKCYENKDYKKALNLFETVQSAYRGKEELQTIMHYLSICYIKRKDFESAIHYLQNYINNYVRGEYVEESHYMLAYCHYKLSPEYELDQTETQSAIEELQRCLTLYPSNEKAEDAKKMLEEMTNKLAQRELANAKLYLNLGNYRGNNYRAAIVTSQNAMNDYPDCPYIEEFAFIIVKSKYKETIESNAKKLRERCEDSRDECYYFISEYPDTRHRKEVEKMAKQLDKIAENLKKQQTK